MRIPAGWMAVVLALGFVVSLPAVWADETPAEGAPPAPAAPAAPAAPVPPAPVPAAPAGPALAFPDEGLIQRADGSIVYFYRTNFVTPNDLMTSLSKLLAVPDVQMKEFPRQNVLLFEGQPDAVELALEAAAYFDVSTPQAFIEAKVIEITYESNFEFGLDYLWSRDQAGPNTLFRGAEGVLNPPSFIQSTLPGGLPFQGSSLLFGFVGKKADKFGLLDITLQALQLEGKAEVLSKPSIICTQGVEAKVNTSESRLILQFDRAQGANVTYKGFPLDTGVDLTVKATHIGESFLTLDINPVVRGVQGISVIAGGTLKPVTTTRSVQTTVTMADGETLVIGGLYTNRSLTDNAKTPLLSDIPLLGVLFTRTQETKVKTELIFMLTPTIVRKTSELKVITPPAELERLEGAAGQEEYVPAGPSLRVVEGCRPPPPRPPPPPVTARPVTSRALPPPPTARR